jgi:hypothetical protein
MTGSGVFPEGFAQLEPFAPWALPTERARHAKKNASSMVEVQAFYDAMLPILPGALEHLSGFALSDLPAPGRRLLDLCLAMVEAAMAIENFGAVSPPFLMSLDRFEPVHDFWTRAGLEVAR